MAKRASGPAVKHLSYCAGQGMVGDGTQATSPCPFHDSREIEAERYVCARCAMGILPDQIIAGPDGPGAGVADVSTDLAVAPNAVAPQPVPEVEPEPNGAIEKIAERDQQPADVEIPNDKSSPEPVAAPAVSAPVLTSPKPKAKVKRGGPRMPRGAKFD